MNEQQRKTYELNDEEFAVLMEAGKPVPYMIFLARPPRSPYENAMNAWRRLGAKRGFEYQSVEPSSKGERFFTAIATPMKPEAKDQP